MANEQNLKPKPFTSENQPPAERKSRKGIPNRATVFKKLLKLKTKITDPSDPEKEIVVNVYEAAAMGQIIAAMRGKAPAFKEIQDTLHGKIADNMNMNVKGSLEISIQKAIDSVYDDDGNDSDLTRDAETPADS